MTFFIDTTDKRTQKVFTILQHKGLHTLPIENLDAKAQKGDIFIYPPSKKWNEQEIHNLPNNTTLFCGNIKFGELLKQKNIIHRNILLDEKFAIQNAQLTAEGVLALILEHSPKSIFSNNILLFGFGRITKACAIIFSKLNLNFGIVTFNKNELPNCYFYTNKVYYEYNFTNELQKYDILVNTRPQVFIDNNVIEKIAPKTIFLETASLDCLDEKLVKHFEYIHAPALPNKYCPESAGEIIANKILGDLKL